MAKNEGEKKVQAEDGAGTGDGARDAGAEAGADYDAAYAHAVAGRTAEAEALCHKFLARDPANAEALHLLGVIAAQGGNAPSAIELFIRALEAKPDFAKAHSNLGLLLLGRGEAEKAVDHFEKAIECEPDYAEAHNNLGNALMRSGRFGDAEKAYARVVTFEPENELAYNNLGVALLRQGRADEAIAQLKTALQIDPNLATAHNNLGKALQRKRDFQGAAASFRRALELRPDLAQVHSNLGAVYMDLGRLEEALACHEKALQLKPSQEIAAGVHSKLGLVYMALGRLDEALACQDKALELVPDLHAAERSRSFILLMQGRFEEGWKAYLSYPSVRAEAGEFYRRPLPANLSGKHVFLHKDHGLGDEIFFLRFAPELKKRGASITYVAGAKIASIVARLPFIDAVVGENAVPEATDVNLSLRDLPYLVAMKSVADIPPPYPLPVQPERAVRMEARLKELGPPPYMGLTWRAGTANKPASLFKEVPLEGLAGVLKQVSGTLLTVQRLPEAGEVEALGQKIDRPVYDFSALNDDLEDMLALLSLMGEYVTVSNTNVHLRAGTGRTSRVLVPNPPEYWWMAEGEESPWFPGCKVYRQRLDGSWEATLDALSNDLAGAVGALRDPAGIN